MTDLVRWLSSAAASPRSPIFTSPWFWLTKMLSHFRSRWTMGGSWL